MEELLEQYRRLDEHSHQLQIQEEERLQRAIKTYEVDQQASRQEVKKQEQEFIKSKKALEAALHNQDTLKRTHEAEVETLKQNISKLKRLKRGSTELPPKIPQLLGPSATIHDSVAHGSGTVTGVLTADSSHESRAKPAERDSLGEPQPHDHHIQDELYDSSQAKLSDDDSGAEEEGLDGNGGSSQSHPHLLPLTNKSIPYKEVYASARDPGANHKHWIIECPKGSGQWYILRCVDHNLNWGRNPVSSATQHLIGKAHGFLKRPNLAIEQLGELVEDCDQQKANRSNMEYKKFLDEGYKPKTTVTNPRQGQMEQARKFPFTVEPSEGVIYPEVGGVYLAWWESHPSGVYLVVILPHLGNGDWKEVGIACNLFDTGLYNKIPKCFNVVKDAERGMRLTWAEGYEDGGPQVSARKFPCLFLHPPLEIPAADKEIVLGDMAEVLAFRSARQLCHRSTTLSPVFSQTVKDNESLARAFEKRLKTIQAKRSPESEQETAVTSQISSSQDQQYPGNTSATTGLGSPRVPSITNVPQYSGGGSNISMSGGGLNVDRGRNGLPVLSTGVSSLRYPYPSTMEVHGPIQGAANCLSGGHARLPDISRPFRGSYGSTKDFGSISQLSDRPASMPAAPSDFQGSWAPKAVRQEAWTQKAIFSQELPEQDRTLRRGFSAEGDVVPEGAELLGRLPDHGHLDDLDGTRRSSG